MESTWQCKIASHVGRGKNHTGPLSLSHPIQAVSALFLSTIAFICYKLEKFA
jgi:hypothetical protein